MRITIDTQTTNTLFFTSKSSLPCYPLWREVKRNENIKNILVDAFLVYLVSLFTIEHVNSWDDVDSRSIWLSHDHNHFTDFVFYLNKQKTIKLSACKRYVRHIGLSYWKLQLFFTFYAYLFLHIETLA